MKKHQTPPAKLLSAFCVLAVLGCPVWAAEQAPTNDDAAVEKRLADAARYLSSDQLEGRGLGTHGIELAAEYIARQFREAGLKTDLCQGQPYQKFPVTTDAELGSGNRLALAGLPAGSDEGPSAAELTLRKDFTPLAASDSNRFDLPLVFVGYGITDRPAGYDDYAGVDVAGKAVVVLRHAPRQVAARPGGVAIDTHHGLLRHKIANAFEHGAAAIVVCTDWAQLLDRGVYEEPLLKFDTAGADCSHPGMTVIQCRRKVLEPAIQAAYGTDLAGLEVEINRGPAPNSRALAGCRISGQTDIRRIQYEAKNVVAVLPGDGRSGEETLVIGAHYDHFGSFRVPGKRQPEIYSGADDNASGVSAMLEIARYLAHRPQPPARRVVFVAFSAEEEGMLGSSYYVNHPLVPLSRTVAMLNLDMVGRLRDNRLYVRGSFTAAGWDNLLRDLDSRHGLTLDLTQGGLGKSDQLAFYAKDIPILHFFTGRHADYHETSDKFETLNIAGMRRVTRFAEDVLASLLDTPARPRCLAVVPEDGDLYFGAFGDFTCSGPGYRLGPVARGGPAEQAGLRDGDVVVRVGENRIAGVEDFKEALTHYGGGERVSVMVQRDKQTREFTVLLGSIQRGGKKMVAN